MTFSTQAFFHLPTKAKTVEEEKTILLAKFQNIGKGNGINIKFNIFICLHFVGIYLMILFVFVLFEPKKGLVQCARSSLQINYLPMSR